MSIGDLELRFEPIYEKFLASAPITAMMHGTLSKEQYMQMLRQVFHHTRENPQLQALATAHFRGRERDAVRAFFAHAASEIGHDQLALNDYITLGGNADAIPYENPLPATMALLSYGFHQIQNHDVVGYLGYLFFLEFTPTRAGAGIMASLEKISIPKSAMTFLRDHTEIDIGHNRMMHKYAKHLIHSDEDIDTVSYAMQTTGYLYEQMLKESIANAENQVDTGWNWEELKADGLTPAHFEKESAVA